MHNNPAIPWVVLLTTAVALVYSALCRLLKSLECDPKNIKLVLMAVEAPHEWAIHLPRGGRPLKKCQGMRENSIAAWKPGDVGSGEKKQEVSYTSELLSTREAFPQLAGLVIKTGCTECLILTSNALPVTRLFPSNIMYLSHCREIGPISIWLGKC